MVGERENQPHRSAGIQRALDGFRQCHLGADLDVDSMRYHGPMAALTRFVSRSALICPQPTVTQLGGRAAGTRRGPPLTTRWRAGFR
ncbi:unnamed protein product [Soboliphyme baturini]|uniref:Transposase n=1 Tax=Soboliphyme baturini TaxID=241478 RepID=A0A183ILE7_9BILA|nr:unnamed protein product [Soboliphyme baturini]